MLSLVTPFMTSRKSLKMQELIGFWRASKGDISSYEHPLQGPCINSVYSSTLGPSYSAIKLRHFTRHSHQGTDIPLPGQAERMVKHVAGCEHTAHLKFLKKIGVGSNLGKSITWSCGATFCSPNDKVHILPSISNFFCILCSFLKQKCFLAGTFSHWLSCYAIPIIRPSPPYTSTMWLSKTIDAPICQRANKFPSSASRTKSTWSGWKKDFK